MYRARAIRAASARPSHPPPARTSACRVAGGGGGNGWMSGGGEEVWGIGRAKESGMSADEAEGDAAGIQEDAAELGRERERF
jgi:hypothetical protein